MERIKGAGHIANLFVAENTALNRPPTEITDGWLNGIQEEQASFIESMGLVLSGADHTLLKQAVAKLIASMCLGLSSQTWQNVAGSRAINTAYTNSTGRPISVRCGCTPTGGTGFYTIQVSGVEVASANAAAGMAFSIYAIVPPGASYTFSKGGGDTTTNLAWSELR